LWEQKKASKIVVIKMGNKIKVHITDDGKGFDPKKVKNKDGIGINQIEARVFMLKGIMNIESEIDGGTRIEINLPILDITKLPNPDLPVL